MKVSKIIYVVRTYLQLIGMIVAAWPGGTITMVNELYGSELKSHVYRAFLLFL